MEVLREEKHPYRQRRRRSIIRNFFRVTSIHGLPAISRAYDSKNLFYWSLIFFVFVIVMLYFVINSILVYFTYPTQTNVDIVAEYPMLFPAVTICNYDIIRYDLFLGPFLKYTNSTTIPDFSNPEVFVSMDQLIINILNKNESIVDYVFELNEFLFSCTYNGLPCTDKDFVQFTSSKYGLCFTFNAKSNNKSIRTTADNGGQGVLELEFFIYDYLNVPYMRDGVGIIAMLHDNTQLPQIDIDGIGLAPNRKHSLQFSKETTSFLSAPYTNCTRTIRADMKSMFEMYYIGTEYQYSRQVCVNICVQAYVYSICKCTSPAYWNTRYVLLDNGQVILAALCNFTDSCYAVATNQFLSNLTIILQECSHCTSECQLTSFDVQLSSILAPAILDQIAIKQWIENNSMINSSRKINLPSDWSTNSTNYINRNYVGLEVTLGTFLVNSYTQSATLTWTDVISNVGGQTGLWIGVSMLSIVELLEMFYRLIRLRLSKMKKNEE